jgi:deoxyribodipyrimidine photolyase-like uncharacterized protein
MDGRFKPMTVFWGANKCIRPLKSYIEQSYRKVYIIHITKLLVIIMGVVQEGFDETTAVRDIEPPGKVP